MWSHLFVCQVRVPSLSVESLFCIESVCLVESACRIESVSSIKCVALSCLSSLSVVSNLSAALSVSVVSSLSVALSLAVVYWSLVFGVCMWSLPVESFCQVYLLSLSLASSMFVMPSVFSRVGCRVCLSS